MRAVIYREWVPAGTFVKTRIVFVSAVVLFVLSITIPSDVACQNPFWIAVLASALALLSHMFRNHTGIKTEVSGEELQVNYGLNMKKIVLPAFVSVFLFVSMLGTGAVITLVGSTTHHVYPGQSIQDSINSAQLGDTIFVHAGTYYEHIVVNKSVSLMGENKEATIIDGNVTGIVVIITTSNVSFTRFTIRRSGQSAWTDSGIFIGFGCSNSKVSDNMVIGNYHGIILESSTGNVISSNNVSWNTGRGISLESSATNTISANLVSRNDQDNGIELFDSMGNVVTANTISANGWAGIYLEESTANIITASIVSNNSEVGICLETSSNNVFYHNNFIDNGLNEEGQVYSSASSNTWNNDAEGNYWSNYNGTDADHDGIGDTPYIVEAHNSDNYPLMGMFSDFSVTHQEETHHVTTISNSAVSAFEFDQVNSVIRFNVTGEESIGHCRVTVPNVIVQNLWQDNYTVLVDGEDPLTIRNWTDGTYTYIYFTYLQSEQEVVIQGVMPSLDTTPPTVSILSPENKTYPVNDVPLTFTLSETISWIGYSLDSQNNVTISGNTTLAGLSDDTYPITVYANDTAGNIGSSDTVYFTIQTSPIDTTPPSISIASPENKTYTTTDIPLNFIVDESVFWATYSLDDEANLTVTGNITLSGLPDGTHTLTVFANDTAGNIGYSDTVYFIVDTVSPNIEILSPENKTYTTSAVSLSFTLDETTSWIGYCLDGQKNVTIIGNTTLSGLSDGLHSLIVYAKDTSGNTIASEKIYFTLETPFCMHAWWLWAIVAIAVVALAGAVYVYKKRKPSTTPIPSPENTDQPK